MNDLSKVLLPQARYATRILTWATLFGVCGAACMAQASTPTTSPTATGTVIYPAKGQSARQQDKDKYHCYEWAKGQTGVDPAQSPRPATGSLPNQSGRSAGAMVRSAAMGAAVGELADHEAGRGAALGVLGGRLSERARERQALQATQQQAAQRRTSYERAFAACMEGRGYVIK